ncbi:hypothetical protein TEA_020011 [Camellia sinensis var. sinensis]|uniref:Uncharacterized protein n=1 Tax=Camellia sinensis var. sinensis TaxID=542762 RepID=A0A4S4EQM3_CAMSN|nr:hypothetical protein TEA_020011 [Camellia sinensis var. sinensis]
MYIFYPSNVRKIMKFELCICICVHCASEKKIRVMGATLCPLFDLITIDANSYKDSSALLEDAWLRSFYSRLNGIFVTFCSFGGVKQRSGSAAVIYSKENLLFLAVIPSDLNRDEWVEALGSYLKHLNSCSRQGVWYALFELWEFMDLTIRNPILQSDLVNPSNDPMYNPQSNSVLVCFMGPQSPILFTVIRRQASNGYASFLNFDQNWSTKLWLTILCGWSIKPPGLGEVWAGLFNLVSELGWACDWCAVCLATVCRGPEGCVGMCPTSPGVVPSGVVLSMLISGSHNLKYMGIDALGRLIKTSPEIAIDCLESLENGAQSYIPKDERSGILNISSFRKQDHHEASTRSLRFEAYELPKPTVPMPSRAPPVSLASSTELVPIPEPSYPREMHQTTAVPSVSDTGPSELKLRLDGVQRKWGRPTYPSPAPSTPSSSLQRPMNGVTQPDGTGNLNSKPCDTSYGSRRSQVQIYLEKQKLAASLFGGPSKPEERPSSTGH